MLKLIFWFSFLATIFVVSEASCPEGSIKWESKCFLFVTEPSKFFLADGDCVNRGGHLASIHDRSTNVFLAQEAPRYITGINVTDFWIGATNIMTANFTWSWMDETPFNFSEWRDFVPPNTQSCGVLNYENGIWIPDYCYRLKPYVCGFDTSQKPPTTTSELPTTKTITEYTTSTKTSSTSSSTTAVPTESVTVTSTFQPTLPSTEGSATIPPLTWSSTPSKIPSTELPSEATSLPTIVPTGFPSSLPTNPPSTEGFTTTHISTTPSPVPTNLTTKSSALPSSSATTSQQNPQTESTATPSSVPTEFPTIFPSTNQPSTTTPKTSDIPTIATQTPSITTNVPPFLSSTTTKPTPQTTFPSTGLPPITTNVPLTESSTVPSVIPTRLSTTAPPTTLPITDSPKPSEIPTVSTQVPPMTTGAPHTASSAIPLTIPTAGPSTNPPSTTTPKPSEVPTLPTQVPPLTMTPATSSPFPQSSTSQSPSPSTTTTTLGPDTYCGASNIFKNAEGKATCWFYTPQLDWDNAEKFCKDRRAHLASLHDDGDIHIASNLDQKDYTSTFIWIGLHSTDNITTWEWIDGTVVDFAPWDKDLNRFSACAHLYENTFHSDFYCTDSTIGVCKKEMFID